METGDYGYYDYGYASTEAGGYAADAWNAGDTAGYYDWTAAQNDAWNTSTDIYATGGPGFGADSSYAGDSYYDGY